MSATMDVDLDQINREAEAKLQNLRTQRQELTLDALTDTKAAKQLASVEADIAVAEQALERAALARVERQRRDEQAERDADAARIAAAISRARELESERRKLAAEVDRAAKAYAEALAAWHDVCLEQRARLQEAGWSSTNAQGALPRPAQIEAALLYALQTAGLPTFGVESAIRIQVPVSARGPLTFRDARVLDVDEEG